MPEHVRDGPKTVSESTASSTALCEFLGLAEFRGESSASSSQPVICVNCFSRADHIFLAASLLVFLCFAAFLGVIRIICVFHGLNMRKVGMTDFVRDGFRLNPHSHVEISDLETLLEACFCRYAEEVPPFGSSAQGFEGRMPRVRLTRTCCMRSWGTCEGGSLSERWPCLKPEKLPVHYSNSELSPSFAPVLVTILLAQVKRGVGCRGYSESLCRHHQLSLCHRRLVLKCAESSSLRNPVQSLVRVIFISWLLSSVMSTW